MTFLEAAPHILRSSRTPLTAREITEGALGQRLINTHGKKPIATMSAALYGTLRTDGDLVKIGDARERRAKRGPVILRNHTVPALHGGNRGHCRLD
jgi:HB1, ASXL, restriction endonuclease HTH domain